MDQGRQHPRQRALYFSPKEPLSLCPSLLHHAPNSGDGLSLLISVQSSVGPQGFSQPLHPFGPHLCVTDDDAKINSHFTNEETEPFSFLSFFFFLIGCSCCIWKFLGQGLNRSCNCGLCHSNAGSLTIEQGQGSNPPLYRGNVKSLTC